MLKYAKVTDDISKSCSVGLGTNSKYYESIGMTLQEVEEAYNGGWYLKGYAPTQPIDEKKEIIYNELWSNYKSFQTKYVDAEDLQLATLCATGGSEKGKSVQMWVMNLWATYYEVKDEVSKCTTLDELNSIDITTNGLSTPLYTIRELNDEAQKYLKSQTK